VQRVGEVEIPSRHDLVPCVTVDDVLTATHASEPRLLKIDVEGSELEAFRGMSFKRAFRPENIIMEFSDQVVSEKEDLDACWELLIGKSYAPFTVTGLPLSKGFHVPEENIWWKSILRKR
jgi:hypothetical protein